MYVQMCVRVSVCPDASATGVHPQLIYSQFWTVLLTFKPSMISTETETRQHGSVSHQLGSAVVLY